MHRRGYARECRINEGRGHVVQVSVRVYDRRQQVTLVVDDSVFLLVEPYVAPEVATVRSQRRQRLITEQDLPYPSLPAGDLHGVQVPEQEHLLGQLPLARHAIQQDLVTDKQLLTGSIRLQPHSGRQAVRMKVTGDI